MNLTPEQVGILFTVVTGLLIALTNYLTSQSTKKKVAELHTKVDRMDATAKEVNKPPATHHLIDGHAATVTPTDVTFSKPPKVIPRG